MAVRWAATGPGLVSVTVHLDPSEWSRHLAEETARGLGEQPPWIPPVWFYDEVGSKLFDQITRLPEYYPTEAERSILRRHSAHIASITGARTLVELGSGTSDKTTLLIDYLVDAGTLREIVPFDVSADVLRASARTLAATYPGVAVRAVVGDFHRHLGHVPSGSSTMIAFLGSTIGNLDPAQRSTFLTGVADALEPGDWFLLGTDLVKPLDVLLTAYDDPDGVTAEFDLNALEVMNRELGADFDKLSFTHRACWNAEESRIEMHLVAASPQVVSIAGLGDMRLVMDRGDHIRTEISTKFTPEGIASELAAAGLPTVESWFDDDNRFMVSLARRR